MILVLWRESEDPSAEARRLLREGLKRLGFSACDPAHDALGKPYLPGGPQISLSHTRGAAAAAISTEGPVGVDLEAMREIRPGLARRTMSPSEYAWYASRGARQEDFFTLWTLKESYYKYLGTGLTGFPNGTDFRLEGDRWRLGEEPLGFFTEKKDLLILSLCGREESGEWRVESGDVVFGSAEQSE